MRCVFVLHLLSHDASWRSVYLQGIDNAEIIDTVHARRAPMTPPAPVCVVRDPIAMACANGDAAASADVVCGPMTDGWTAAAYPRRDD